ncbi:MAG: hypothetical protein HS100_08810 [Anaerolineales bacterium]|nr:hypothetical protein [Anaerolineales bacterium]MCE7859856.1 hypothetical protein [Chloroflexi bacterium CFX2]MCK6581578.1 hypothetical protein [Anaerolineales bacterium]
MRRSNRLMSGLPPFQQGGLDSLCGLYSIINAERIVNRSSDEDAQKLFNHLIHYLSRRGLLSKILIDGIIHKEMLVILNKIAGRKRIANVEIPFRGVPNPDLTTFWKSMQAFLDGTPGRSIVLGLQGYHDHWTVIEKITNRSILLYDSSLIKRLPRTSCTTVYATYQRKHVLLPAQTYYLSNDLQDIGQYDV